MGSDLSDRNINDEARSRIHARNRETEETTEEVRSLLLLYINLLALFYILHAIIIIYVFCGNGFYSIEYRIEQVEVLPCPPHAKPLNCINSSKWLSCINMLITKTASHACSSIREVYPNSEGRHWLSMAQVTRKCPVLTCSSQKQLAMLVRVYGRCTQIAKVDIGCRWLR